MWSFLAGIGWYAIGLVGSGFGLGALRGHSGHPVAIKARIFAFGMALFGPLNLMVVLFSFYRNRSFPWHFAI